MFWKPPSQDPQRPSSSTTSTKSMEYWTKMAQPKVAIEEEKRPNKLTLRSKSVGRSSRMADRLNAGGRYHYIYKKLELKPSLADL